MRTMAKIGVVLAVVLVGLRGLTGCGTNDPLSTLGDPNPPTLDTIFSGSGLTASGNGFSSTHQYWELFTLNFYGSNVLAPAKGLVSSLGLDATTGTSYVTIAHAGRLSTRIAGIVPTVRSGDTVVSGQVIGTFVPTGNISFQVLLNGTPVCPLSFISTNFRSQIWGFTITAGTLCI